ncbi:hypothetical protein ACV8UU_28775 [Citrobacter freundii]|uniref:hypothetical protein n=1 Tax=Citrobacter freundii TaxID=546 RepID=UPI001E2CE731|nr:hypothetical protein [Citrobacter freundii]GJK70790.1 hypothetical protein TUM17564_28170 [Citrobacter freundii]
MTEKLEKLIENTLKDILLANAVLTLIFAMPMAVISKYGLSIIIWFMTVLISPALCAVGAWLVSRISHHADKYFHSKWTKRMYIFYVIAATECLLVYSIVQIMKNLIK